MSEHVHVGFQWKRTPAASLKRRKGGSGTPIHIQMTFILVDSIIYLFVLDSITSSIIFSLLFFLLGLSVRQSCYEFTLSPAAIAIVTLGCTWLYHECNCSTVLNHRSNPCKCNYGTSSSKLVESTWEGETSVWSQLVWTVFHF